jgi:curved DNA-binding protein CbpA
VSNAKDPHSVLGVPPDADAETIKRAFRARAREHHPDRSRAPGAEARFRELVEAYELLGARRPTRREQRLDISGIVSFYAWLAGRQPPPASEPPADDPLAEEDEVAPPPRRLGSRAARVAAAAGLLYAVALLVLLLTR